MVYFHEWEIGLHPHEGPVGSLGEGLFAYAYERGHESRPAQDIVRAKGLDIFETVGQENVYAFHKVRYFIPYSSICPR